MKSFENQKTYMTDSCCQFYHEKHLSEMGWFSLLMKKDLFLLELVSTVRIGALINGVR